jgi:hypothetical protein
MSKPIAVRFVAGRGRIQVVSPRDTILSIVAAVQLRVTKGFKDGFGWITISSQGDQILIRDESVLVEVPRSFEAAFWKPMMRALLEDKVDPVSFSIQVIEFPYECPQCRTDQFTQVKRRFKCLSCGREQGLGKPAKDRPRRFIFTPEGS